MSEFDNGEESMLQQQTDMRQTKTTMKKVTQTAT